MKDARLEYERALADFSQPGGRWNAKGRLTYWGKAAGLTADEIIDDAHAAGVRNRDADIRRGWNDAKPKGDRPAGERRFTRRARPSPPPTFPRYVRDMVQAGGGEATSADLRALSPLMIRPDGWLQCALFVSMLGDAACGFANGRLPLYVFDPDRPAAGRLGVNLRSSADWMKAVMRADELPGEVICPNPFTGAEGLTTEGKPSLVAKSCLARFPFAVIEFDAMPLAAQSAFWRGLLTKSPLAAKVAAIVYSGGKSLHGLLHIGADSLEGWQRACEGLRRLLAADPDGTFRIDEQAMRPRQGCRLPGVMRRATGKMQELLYLNPDAVPTKDRSTLTRIRTHAHARETPAEREEPRTGEKRRPRNADALRAILGPFGAIPRRLEWGRYSGRCNGPAFHPLRWQRFFDLR